MNDPLSAAPFAREELHELFDGATARLDRRRRRQVWLLGLGLAALALGLPSERLWGPMDLVRRVAGNGEGSTGILLPLGMLLDRLSGLGPERVCFLFSALAYGLLVPSLANLLRTIGFEPRLSLLALLSVLLSPVLALSASLPLDFAPGALGATWLLTTLFQPRERLHNGYQWRAALLFFVAFLLRPENALLLPAVLWAVARHGGRSRGPIAAVTSALVLFVALQILISGQPQAFWDAVLAGRHPGLGAIPTWLLYLPLGMGPAALGLYSLLFGRRLPEETPAPTWMVPWCLVALAPIVGGSPSMGPVGAFLFPAAAVGLADWLTRREREEEALRLGSLLLILAALLAVGTRLAWEQSDPEREDRRALAQLLEPTDLVITSDPIREYWCKSRWEIRTAPSLAEATERYPEQSHRLVLLEPPSAGAVLSDRLPVWVLRGDSLVKLAPGESWRP